MTEEQVPSDERVEEHRVEANNIAQQSSMPNIGSKPSQPRHFNFPKRRFGKFIALSKLHGLIDGRLFQRCGVLFCLHKSNQDGENEDEWKCE